MGLAASQARLLTITARKADCEYQSMSLSHEKIALSRDMERFSDEYQAALGKTKLIYDYYGSGTSQMALNYSLFMTPSIYNDYSPKLLTNSKNRVVLNSRFAAAAAAAGIPQEGYMGTPSSDIRNRFIQGLIDTNVVTSIVGSAIQNITYNNTSGLGSDLESFQATKQITYEALIEQLKAKGETTQDYGLQMGGLLYKHKDQAQYDGQKNSGYPDPYLLGRHDNDDDHKEDMYSFLFANGDYDVDRGMQNHTISLTDLLSDENHYVYGLRGLRGSAIPINTMAYMQQFIAGVEGSNSFLNWMTDQFEKVLGGTTKNELALNYAYNQVYDLIYPNEDLTTTSYALSNKYYFGNRKNRDETQKNSAMEQLVKENGNYVLGKKHRDTLTSPKDKSFTGVAPQAENYVGMCFSLSDDAGNEKQYHGVAIDLNNLAKVFLTAYVEFQQGIEKSNYYYDIGKVDNLSLFDTERNNYKFTVADSTEYEDGTTNLTAQYYDELLNIICTQGWTENAQIDDQAYMQQLLKNNTIFISSKGNDNRYTQNSYNTDVYISEVADTDAVAQAEAKYNTEKAKIESKENQIDLKLKNLDTEISALTTEYDTTKSLVSKIIEKSIKRYEA